MDDQRTGDSVNHPPRERDPKAYRDYQRTGDTTKCPVDQRPVDPEAFQCPHCGAFFCFKCRLPLLRGKLQFRCVNQRCRYHGKLVCAGCVAEIPVMVDEPKEVLVQNAKDVNDVSDQEAWGACVLVMVAAVYFRSWVGLSWWGALFGGGVIGLIVAGWLRSLKHHVEPVYQTVIESVEVGRRKSCIRCQQAVEHLVSTVGSHIQQSDTT